MKLTKKARKQLSQKNVIIDRYEVSDDEIAGLLVRNLAYELDKDVITGARVFCVFLEDVVSLDVEIDTKGRLNTVATLNYEYEIKVIVNLGL